MADTTSADDKKWNVMLGTVTLIVLFYFGVNQAMWFVIAICYPEQEINASVLAILNQGTGYIGAFAGGVIGFWVGSSKGSQDKDDATKLANKTAADAVSTAATATASTQATLDKTAETLAKVLGTGNGGNGNGKDHGAVPPLEPGKPVNATIDGDVTLTPTAAPDATSKDKLVERAGQKFAAGEYNEVAYRGVLQSKEIGLTDAETDAEVVKWFKPGGTS